MYKKSARFGTACGRKPSWKKGRSLLFHLLCSLQDCSESQQLLLVICIIKGENILPHALKKKLESPLS